jgi:exo-beta-1,3-glucanase (GH17 family)/cellulose synthase/poly-beta-1,6-N-acetylglucosamine synthase-like glycosyltransferase
MPAPVTPSGRGPRFAQVLAPALMIVLCIASLNLTAWRTFDRQVQAPDHDGLLTGLSYNGANRWQSPLEGQAPPPEGLERDLALLSRHTRRIRTYAAADHAALPAIARAHGLQVMLGAWLDDRPEDNRRELAAAIDQARSHPNVHRLIVGNETQLKATLPPNRLATYLDQARAALRETAVEVSTAEPWHVWLAQPQLARHVDFIAIHVLPYWEKVSIESAVQTSLQQIARVQARFPDRRVVVAEIGWPSNGPPLGAARATTANQALFIRRFLQQAHAAGLDYYLIEAFDQPWKMATEGRAGAYWGLWDTWREAKFAWTGPVVGQRHGTLQAVASSMAGATLMGLFLLAAPRMRWAGRIVFCLAVQAVVSLVVVLLSIPLSHYLRPVDVVGLALVVVALGFICATLLALAFEFTDRFWPARQCRPVQTAVPAPTTAPFISIHLACANEPPGMVMQTVDSLLGLDWPAFEVIVIDNNTIDPQARETLAHWIAHRQDARLRFAQWEHLAGYKSGALNKALEMTDPAAEWIAVVDADYIVDPQWFRRVQTHFHDQSVGLVQAPQAHRRWEERPFDRMMNWETEGFFRIGMHHRHARNAIIQHGTMTLVRAAELRRLRWDEDCVCEDTELGLRLLRAGHRAVYVDEALGAGLLPRDFAAYARQRKRWAQGAMQILRQHAGSLLGPSPLTWGQRYHFLAGWLPWLGDGLHLMSTVIMIAFSLGMVYLPDRVDPPLWLFVLPLIAFFGARLLIGPLLYTRCVPCGPADRLGAAVAGMALSHRIARGVWQGLRRRHAVFEVTPKAAITAPDRDRTDDNAKAKAKADPGSTRFVQGIQEEFALLVGLLFCIALLALSHSPADTGRLGWIAILCIQSLPYWAAVGCRLIEDRGRARARPACAGAEGSSPKGSPAPVRSTIRR